MCLCLALACREKPTASRKHIYSNSGWESLGVLVVTLPGSFDGYFFPHCKTAPNYYIYAEIQEPPPEKRECNSKGLRAPPPRPSHAHWLTSKPLLPVAGEIVRCLHFFVSVFASRASRGLLTPLLAKSVVFPDFTFFLGKKEKRKIRKYFLKSGKLSE